MLAALVGCAIVLAIQGKVPFALGPFALVWGLLLLPTFFLWTTFVARDASRSPSNRYATYAIGLAVMVHHRLLRRSRDKMTWALQLGPVERDALERHRAVRARLGSR